MAIKIKKKKHEDDAEETISEEQEEVAELPADNELEREIEEGIIDTPDVFQRAAVQSVDAASRHSTTFVVGVVVVILLGISSYFLLNYLEDRKTQMSSELNPVFQANAALIKGSEEFNAIEKEKPDFVIASYDSEKAREEVILKAASEVTRDAKDDPISVAAMLAEASAQLKLNQPDKAQATYENLLSLTRDKNIKVMGSVGLLEAFKAQQKYDDALKVLNSIEKEDDSSAKALRYTKAKLLDSMGKKEDAKKLYQEILDDNTAGLAKSDIERRLANL